jgi:hypothetical protein
MKKQVWIQDPKTASTARFHWDPKSWSQDPWYFVDSGRPLTGAPPLLKTRKHMRRNDARKLWLALKEPYWRPVKHQCGGEIEPDPRRQQPGGISQMTCSQSTAPNPRDGDYAD